MAKMDPVKKSKKQQRKIEMEKNKKSQSLVGWTVAVVLLACIVLIVFKAISGPPEVKAIDAGQFQYEQQPALGSADAPVKIVEFADFKCPACKYFDQTIIPQLKKDFIDNGTAQLYFINFPVIQPIPQSEIAAMAGEAVFQQSPDAFWKFYEAVYAHQGDENTDWATPDALVEIAKQAGLDIDFDQMKQDIENQTFAQNVKDDEAIGTQLGISSTPTIYINGKEVSGENTFNYDAIKEAIQEAAGK